MAALREQGIDKLADAKLARMQSAGAISVSRRNPQANGSPARKGGPLNAP